LLEQWNLLGFLPLAVVKLPQGEEE